MAEISKYARGLPSLLDLKVSGQGPRVFSDQVVGTIHLLDNYLLQGRESIIATANVAPAVGFNSTGVPTHVVPQNELWYVWEIEIGMTCGAGAAIRAAAAARYDGLAVSFNRTPFEAVAATFSGFTSDHTPFWATPGTELGFIATAVTLAPSVTLAYLVTKLRL